MLWAFRALADVITDQMRKLRPPSGTHGSLGVNSQRGRQTSIQQLRQQHTTAAFQQAPHARPSYCRSVCDVRRLMTTELLCRRDDIDVPVDWADGAAAQHIAWGIGWLCEDARASWPNVKYSVEYSMFAADDVTEAKRARCRALRCPCGAWALLPGPARLLARPDIGRCRLSRIMFLPKPHNAQCMVTWLAPEWKGIRAKMRVHPHELLAAGSSSSDPTFSRLHRSLKLAVGQVLAHTR